jgi:hypothetical protein
MPDRIHGVCRAFGLWANEDFPSSLAHNFTIRKITSIRNVRVAHQNYATKLLGADY